MNVLLIGSNSKTHALAWKISKSSILDSLFILNGNYGTKEVGKNLEGNPLDFDFVKETVFENNISMVIVCDYKILLAGIVDYFQKDETLSKIGIIGANKESLRLTVDDFFVKEFMKRNKVQSPKFKTFTKDKLKQGLDYAEQLKTDFAINIWQKNKYGSYSGTEIDRNDINETIDFDFISVEEILPGQEIIQTLITDGDGHKILPEIKVFQESGKTKSNHVVFGGVSPVKFVDDIFYSKIYNQIVVPVLRGLKKENINCNGFLSLKIINNDSEPYLIGMENFLSTSVSETIFPRLASDLLDLFDGVVNKTLSEHHIEIDIRSSFSNILYSNNMSDRFNPIYGLNSLMGCQVFFENVSADGPVLTTSGGNVLTINSLGKDYDDVYESVMEGIEKITLEGSFYKKDINVRTF